MVKQNGLLSVLHKIVISITDVIFSQLPTTYSFMEKYEPRCEKTGLQGFRPGPTQTGLCSHRRWLDA